MAIPADTVLRAGDVLSISATVDFATGSSVYVRFSEHSSPSAVPMSSVIAIVSRNFQIGDLVNVPGERHPLVVIAVHSDFLWAKDRDGVPTSFLSRRVTLFNEPAEDVGPGPDPVGAEGQEGLNHEPPTVLTGPKGIDGPGVDLPDGHF